MWVGDSMKKNKFLCLLLCTMFFTTCSLCYAQEIETQTFTDNSGIEKDIVTCDLDLNDYKKMNDVQYNKYDVILLTESVAQDNSLINYIYVYNAYRKPEEYSVKSFQYSINNSFIYASSTLVDKTDTISKYKVITNIKYFDTTTTNRNYVISSAMINDAKVDIDFTANVNQQTSKIELSFNGYIFITGKDLLNITPIKNSVYANNSIYSKNGAEYYSYDADGNGYNKVAASLMFLNFDTNKDIDKINEIDLKYKVWRGRSDYDYLGNEYHKTVNYSYPELWSDYSKKYRTISSDTMSVNYEYSPSQLPFKYTNKMALSLKTTYVNKTDGSRTSAFPAMFDNLSSEKLNSGYTAKESFDKRQVSMLIDALPVYLDGYFVVAYDNWYYWNFKIEDLEVMRINFTTDGVTYNQKCNSGDPIDSETPGIIDPGKTGDDEKSLWEQLLDALKDLLVNHTLKFFLLIISIIAFFIVLFKYGIKAIFRLIVKIITWPFKLLKSLFMRG